MSASNGFGSFWVGNSGLSTSSNGIYVSGNNLANLTTEGYVRQRALQADKIYNTTDTTKAIGISKIGSGVTTAEILHSRDIFLDKYFRQENGRESFYNVLSETTDEIETIFQELEGEAFETTLDEVWQAFAELAKDPSDSVNQELIVQKASLFISKAQDLMNGLKEYQSNLNKQVTDTIDTINSLGATIADLNKRIAAIEAGGIETAYTLRDERDKALDELSQYVKIDYEELLDTTVRVKIEGVTFVDMSKVYGMSAYSDDVTGYVEPAWDALSDYDNDVITYVYNIAKGFSTEHNSDIGSLKALLIARGEESSNYVDLLGVSGTSSDTTNVSTLQEIEAMLDTLVHEIVTETNNLVSPLTTLDSSVMFARDTTINGVTYAAGSSMSGVKVWDSESGYLGSDLEGPGQELFSRLFVDRYTEVLGIDSEGNSIKYYVYNEEDYNDTTTLYSTMNLQVNPTLMDDATMLPYQNVQGDVALDLGTALDTLWESNLDALGGYDFVEYYTSIIDHVGILGTTYDSLESTLESTVTAIQSERDQVMTVSSDEELTNMIKYQNAYNAASRYINVINEMVELIVQLI